MTVLVPREHGAYGQLLLPLLTAAAIGRPSFATLAIGVGAAAAFIGHEPLMVLLGRRGAAVLRAQRRDARRWLFGTGTAAFALGVAALLWLPAASRWTLFVPLASAAVAAVWIARGRERTTSGEIVVAAALASVSFPVAVASAASTTAALTCATTFAVAFGAATVGVRAVVDAARGSRPRVGRVLALGTVTLFFAPMAALAASGVIMPAGLWAASPVAAVALALVLALPPARYLRPIGWTLVGVTTLSGVILVTALR
jgi:hypothetical protein